MRHPKAPAREYRADYSPRLRPLAPSFFTPALRDHAALRYITTSQARRFARTHSLALYCGALFAGAALLFAGAYTMQHGDTHRGSALACIGLSIIALAITLHRP
jgi:hypothetical protein